MMMAQRTRNLEVKPQPRPPRSMTQFPKQQESYQIYANNVKAMAANAYANSPKAVFCCSSRSICGLVLDSPCSMRF